MGEKRRIDVEPVDGAEVLANGTELAARDNLTVCNWGESNRHPQPRSQKC